MEKYQITRQYKRELTGKNSVFLLAGFLAVLQISPWLFVPYLFFFLTGIALVIAEVYEQRIVINPRDIEYHGVGFDIKVEWINIQKIDTDLLLGEEGLYIDKSNVVATNQYFNLKPYKGFRDSFFYPVISFCKELARLRTRTTNQAICAASFSIISVYLYSSR
jgi:hypothetical protein